MEKLGLEKVDFSHKKKLIYRKIANPCSEEIEKWHQKIHAVFDWMKQSVYGQKEMVTALVISVITNAHLILYGNPGVGKSNAIRALCACLDGNLCFVHGKIDFIGTNFLVAEELDHTDFSFRRDLLTAMQEGQVLINQEVFYLNTPFIVIATINPDSLSQTPLRESELDRFPLFLEVKNPDPSSGLEILKNFQKKTPYCLQEPIMKNSEILELNRFLEQIKIPDFFLEKIAKIPEFCATNKEVQRALQKSWDGFSPRTCLNLCKISRAMAVLGKRSLVTGEDICNSMSLVFTHRIPAKDDQVIKILEQIKGFITPSPYPDPSIL